MEKVQIKKNQGDSFHDNDGSGDSDGNEQTSKQPESEIEVNCSCLPTPELVTALHSVGTSEIPSSCNIHGVSSFQVIINSTLK